MSLKSTLTSGTCLKRGKNSGSSRSNEEHLVYTVEIHQTHLHDVLHQWCPAGQLIGLLAHAFLPVQLLSSAEGGLIDIRRGGVLTTQAKWRSELAAGCTITKERIKEKERRGGDRRVVVRWSYICDDGNTQVSHVGDDLAVLGGNLGMLDQFVQVFLCNTWRQMFVFPKNQTCRTHPEVIHLLSHIVKKTKTKQNKFLPLVLLTIFEKNVEQDDADFVIRANISIQQDGHNGPHRVFDLFSLGVCAHSQILRQTNMHDSTPSQKRISTKWRHFNRALSKRHILICWSFANFVLFSPVPRDTVCPLFPGNVSCSPQLAADEWSTEKHKTQSQNTRFYFHLCEGFHRCKASPSPFTL